MKTVGIFGCSWCWGIGDYSQNWPYELSLTNKDIIVKNFSFGATSLKWSYERFERYKKECDITIFQFTLPFRLTIQHSEIIMKQRSENLFTIDTFDIENKISRWTGSSSGGRIEKNASLEIYLDYLRKNDDDMILKEYFNIIQKIKEEVDYCFFFKMPKPESEIFRFWPESEKYTEIDCIERICKNYNQYLENHHFNLDGNKWLANYINQKVLLKKLSEKKNSQEEEPK